MYKRFTILLLLAFTCSVSLAWGQTNYPHGQHDPSQDPGTPKERVVKVYPNPATTSVNFGIQQNNNESNLEIIVYNFLGKRMAQINFSGSVAKLDLSKYYSGIYIYQLRDSKGNLVESGKFNVIRQ